MDISREDLIEMKEEIKAHVDLRLAPITEKLQSHQKTLYGPDGRNGIVGDVRDMGTTIRVVKWLAGLGGISGLGAAISRLFGGHE